MKIKVENVVAFLFIHVYGVHANTCRTQYSLSKVCPTDYGQWLDDVTGVMSSLSCSELCAAHTECLSYMFDAGRCQLNAEEAPMFSPNCITKVAHGLIEKATCRQQWLSEPCNGTCLEPHSHLENNKCTCKGGYIHRRKSDSCEEDPNCMQPMVSGVADSQLTASSTWDDHLGDYLPPKNARLDAGCWASATLDTSQWIQVDFNGQRVISGIVIKGRDPAAGYQQWVTSFKVLVSTDCGNWSGLVDEGGNPLVFTGTTGPDVVVERHLPERVVAMCVRVNPVTWRDHISLRFDVLGCSI